MNHVSSRRWLFLTGCYNSGTTLLANILCQHPQIACLPREGQFLSTALVTPKAAGVPRLWAEKETLFRFAPDEKQAEAGQVKRDWQALADKPEAPFILEKSPTDAARTRWLQAYFQPAYFIHIVRNGYAVALGIRHKIHKDFGPLFPDLLEKAARQWTRSLEVVNMDRPHLERFLEIRYENFCEHPHAVMTEIWAFLGLPPLAAESLTQTYHIHELQSPIQNQNPARLAAMTADEAARIERVAGEMLRRYGYDF